jgi:inorganic pyrophosphatase
MVNMWHDISYGDKAPNEINVIIEIPAEVLVQNVRLLN